MTTLADTMMDMGRKARRAATDLAATSPASIDLTLRNMAAALRDAAPGIIKANARDVGAATERKLGAAMIDRLVLDATRIDAIAGSLEEIAAQQTVIGAVQDQWSRPNGLRFAKVSVPIGVIGMIYESRPNVTADAAALCLKSGNAVILRGGSEAVESNRAISAVLRKVLAEDGLPEDAVQLVMTQDRDAVGHLLSGLDATVDLIIPRGGKGLVERVQREARVPVLAHLDGLNHTYVHEDAEPKMALDLIANAKMRRTGVCGATETALVDAGLAERFIPDLVATLTGLGCEVRGDERARAIHPDMTTATPQDFDTEHLAPIINLAVVDGLEEALNHISRHGSGHTEAIVTANADAAQAFLNRVDSAIVVHNASTQFADGGEFGFGAEIGIATGRLHARGPVGAQHLTTFKYQVSGDGTLRP